MHRTSLLVLLPIATTLGLSIAVAPRPADAQVPDEFTNLQILPKDVSKRELVDTMRGFASALGVRCSHCHVGPDNLQGMDFATDELATKKTARQMLRMVHAINGEHLAGLEIASASRLEVGCKTCHRGLTRPEPIGRVIAATLESDGTEAAIARYRELRDEYYGRAAYDFGPQPINTLAEGLFAEGRQDDAIALIEMNNELHPDYAWSRTLLARFHIARGETDLALASLEEALAIQPDSEWIQGQIEKLKQARDDDAESED